MSPEERLKVRNEVCEVMLKYKLTQSELNHLFHDLAHVFFKEGVSFSTVFSYFPAQADKAD
jgi:hypothetical protein